MSSRLGAGARDPLAALIGRIIDDLKQRTAAGLAAGAALEGEGWRLAAMNLTVRQGKLLRDLSFAQIDHAAMFDGKLCVWMQGEDEPAAKIDPNSKNAPVLSSLLAEWLEHRKAEPGEAVDAAASQGRLGRLLFERRRNEGLMLGLVFGPLGLACGTVLMFQPKTQVAGLLVIAGACAALRWDCSSAATSFAATSGLTRRRAAAKCGWRMPTSSSSTTAPRGCSITGSTRAPPSRSRSARPPPRSATTRKARSRMPTWRICGTTSPKRLPGGCFVRYVPASRWRGATTSFSCRPACRFAAQEDARLFL